MGKPVVSLRGGFSDRMGIEPINTEMQIESFDERTRVAMINEINREFFDVVGRDLQFDYASKFLVDILQNVYSQNIQHRMGYAVSENYWYDFVNKTIKDDSYHAVLTVIEYAVQKLDEYQSKYNNNPWDNQDLFEAFNAVFKKEYVGYRFINKVIVPITNDIEIEEISKAVKQPYENVNMHLEKAIRRLSDRESPDYENSIKESISAVEAMCSNILGHPKTLSDALKELTKTKPTLIHPALNEAFLRMYGYAGDSTSGIRHAKKLGGKDATFQEARYMLIACSAFVNYLIANFSEIDSENDKT